MSEPTHERAPEATELVYLPEPSWKPIFVAAGLGALLAAIFTWWVYGLVGAVLMLLALRGWVREASADVNRLPRRQRPTAAVLPAVPPRRPSDS